MEYFSDESDKVDAIEKVEPMHISEIAYELYKMNWIATHVSRAGELSTYREYLKYRNECLKKGEEVDCFEEWLWDTGYGNGSLYVCYEEFCDGEYHDREFIAYLFGYEEDFVKEYLEDIKDDYLEEVD